MKQKRRLLQDSIVNGIRLKTFVEPINKHLVHLYVENHTMIPFDEDENYKLYNEYKVYLKGLAKYLKKDQYIYTEFSMYDRSLSARNEDVSYWMEKLIYTCTDDWR